MEPWEPHMSITHEGDTEPADPCVTARPQVLTSSTKKGDGENKYISNWVELWSVESHVTTL